MPIILFEVHTMFHLENAEKGLQVNSGKCISLMKAFAASICCKFVPNAVFAAGICCKFVPNAAFAAGICCKFVPNAQVTQIFC